MLCPVMKDTAGIVAGRDFCDRVDVPASNSPATHQNIPLSASVTNSLSTYSDCIDPSIEFPSIYKMRLTLAALLPWVAALGTVLTEATSHHPQTKPVYQPLPPLRQQADIQDAWTQSRKDQIPALLRKYGVDAWLVYSPDPCPTSTG